MSAFTDTLNLSIGILNTSIASENTGDIIIMEAALKQIEECLPMASLIHLTTHEKLSRTSFRLQRKVNFNIACGTNLLHSRMELVKQWNVGFVASCYMKPTVLLGVGWRAHANRKTSYYTRLLLRTLLSRRVVHSVRDSYTEKRLKQIGFNNVINTSCPTMWGLTPAHCADVPADKGQDVVTTLTDYSKSPRLDQQLFDVLKKLYRRVYFWPQGSGDVAYLASIADSRQLEILSPSLKTYDTLLNDRSLSLDYVGTRLHAGIRALQKKRRSLIIGIDHRAREKARDFNLPVLNRFAPSPALEQCVRDRAACAVSLPHESIDRWKQQFSDESLWTARPTSHTPLKTA
jgi:polysaccharide pyruvyl transferase WcaK-like protein